MSENPFKIIRSTDQPPEHLRNEVLGSVKFVMLLMRILQLFVADPSAALFERIRVVGGSRSSRSELPPDPLIERSS
ncbi:MAG: hypothetical protein E6Q44_00595 [Flavobacteriales bacterium]|nr:MAG: hypothetical protein E6Q44_00595 [Flavobacteriales bacterium]